MTLMGIYIYIYMKIRRTRKEQLKWLKFEITPF